MSDQIIDENKSWNSPGGTPRAGEDPASESSKKASPITPTPVKKSKRQAERAARGAFAATLRKEEEESWLYQSKKTKTKKRSKPDSGSNNDKGKPKQPLSDGEASEEALQVVTPQPTKPTDAVTSSSSKKNSKATKLSESGSQTGSQHEIGSGNKDKTGTIHRKRRKLVYKAISKPDQSIDGYALHMVSLVCNNAYSVTKNSTGQKKSTLKTASSPKNNVPPIANNIQDRTSNCIQQPHMILDRPRNGFTVESEPTKERIMRLQLRQRFASATSMGMSPIEFARKLLKLWGGTLEQVYETTKCAIERPNKLSTTDKVKIKIGENGSLKRKNNACSSSATKKNRSGTSESSNGEGDNGVHCESVFDQHSFAPNSMHANIYSQHNTNPAEFDVQSFGGSTDRVKRAKKLLKKRRLKDLKKAEAKGSASLLGDSTSGTQTIAPATSTSPSQTSSSRRKPVKRTPRKFTEDPSVPVLFRDMRLSHPDDDKNVNALHCFVREKLLEVYALQGETCATSDSSKQKKTENEMQYNDVKIPAEETPNIVGIRCIFCGRLPKKERGKGQSMSTFFPKSIGEIYRGVCTWQRIHFPLCEYMPEDYRAEYKVRKEKDLTRGKKAHWVKSAYDLGFRNIDSERSGITYKPDSPYKLEEVLKIEVDPGGRSSKTKRSSSENVASLQPQGSALAEVDFELFGTDFDRSVEESADVLANTKRDEPGF